MDLHSLKNRTLLKNCIVIKRHELKLNEENPELEDNISYYENLYEILKADNIKTLVDTLNDSNLKETYLAFNLHILLTPEKEIANEYLALTKSLMLENHVYSEEKFDELKKAFYKGNEDLNPEKVEEYEEEPEMQASPFLTDALQNSLKKLKDLIHRPSKTMSVEEFKKLSETFKDTVLFLAVTKFQQYFDQEDKKITNLQISCDRQISDKPVYRTDFSLVDHNWRESHLSLAEPTTGFISNYYQNLCFAYLQAEEATQMEEKNLSPEWITSHMETFSKCYEYLKEMCNCKVNILANNRVSFSNETSIEPTELDYELAACNSEPQPNVEDEFSI